MRRLYEERAYGPEPVANCYWTGTVGAPAQDPAAEGDLSCEFVVIGAGFTGLNAALELAKSGADVVVVDSNAVGWGASGRNGGFCCEGGSKLSLHQIARRHGEAEAKTWHRTQRAAIDLVDELLQAHEIDADRHSDGETLLAHKPKIAAGFEHEARIYREEFGVDARAIPKHALAEHGLDGPGFHGAMTTPLGFALNPMKYVLGLAEVARQRGVRIFANSPVQTMAPVGGGWRLVTPQARITARTLILATNGYSTDGLPRWISDRYLPVQSSIMVTRKLTEAELQAQGFDSMQMCYDSRKLLHYFRRLPDGRFLFGMRGGIRADRASDQAIRAKIRKQFETMFPDWKHVETEYLWSGLACLSASLTPFAGPLGHLPHAYGAFAYHGNGVSMASYCGRVVADLALKRQGLRPVPSFLSQPPRRFGLGRYRRVVLKLAYGWNQFGDR